jgi:glutathione S-transferase
MACFSCFEGLGGKKAAAPPRLPTGPMTLKYFPISGRAEPIRLALRIGGIGFEDQRIPAADWPAAKKLTPYGQVPVLIVEQQQLAQTKAILRYIGKLARHQGHPLYPQDPLLAAKVDELLDAFDDVWILLAPTYRIKDQSQKEAARQKLFGPGGEAAAMIRIFDGVLKDSKNGFLVPEAGLTVADLAYFCYLNTIRSGFVDGLTPQLLDSFPAIKKHKELLAGIPVITQYYADPKSNPDNLPIYDVFKPGK